jgi:hypothetical protein
MLPEHSSLHYLLDPEAHVPLEAAVDCHGVTNAEFLV